MEKPEYLELGEQARLIPVVADTSKEQRAASILMAALISVHEFRKAMLGSIGVRVGKRATLDAWTEISFKQETKAHGERKDRPDCLLILNTGKKTWRALVEAKIGNNEIGEQQLIGYVNRAKENGIDAVISLTNQLVALPTHSPVKLSKSQTKGIELFHWSWMFAVTQAELLLQSDGIEDADQVYLLREVVRFFDHPSSGVHGFNSMNKHWKDLVGAVGRTKISKTSEEVELTVSSWHQEQRDLCLIMSRLLGERVELKLTRTHAKDPAKRLKDDAEKLASEHKLEVTLSVPNAAADIVVTANLSKRAIFCGMKLAAPKDRKSASARINWLLRQLSDCETENFWISAIRTGRAMDSDARLADVMTDKSCLDDDASAVPTAFEVFYMRDLAGRFSGSKIFIEELEKALPHFYDQVGQYLRAWVAPPPKMPKEHDVADDAEIAGEENDGA